MNRSFGALKPPPTSYVMWLIIPLPPPPARDRLSYCPSARGRCWGRGQCSDVPRIARFRRSGMRFELDSVEESATDLNES